MAYRISGLDPATLDPAALSAAIRVTATHRPGFPCRVGLEDAAPGETMLLLHHVSHDVTTPYRSAYAIFVREGAERAEPFVDRVPPVFDGRPLGLRGFDVSGMLTDARLALPGGADQAIRALLANPVIAYIDAHNAAHGCFVARVERDDA